MAKSRKLFQCLWHWGFEYHIRKLIHWWRPKLRKVLSRILGFEDINAIAYNLLYEMKDVIDNKRTLLLPRIASSDDTIEELLNTEKSFARFGDGEFKVMFFGGQIGFQKHDTLLAERLKEVLAAQDPNLMIGLRDMFGALGHSHGGWERELAGKCRDHINPLLDATKQYYNAMATRTRIPERILKLKKIWEGKKVVTIEGSMCRLGVGNDLFDHVETLRRILAPAECAFSAYDRILEEALKIEKNTLFLIALGPTATVLAHDLCKAGYRAIDIGHLDIFYEQFLCGEKKPGSPLVAIKGKYINELGWRSPAPCTDPAYLSQIIVEVKPG